MGLQIVVNLQSHPWALSADIRLPNELQSSVDSTRSISLPHWRHVPPYVLLNLSSSGPSASLILHSTLGPLFGFWPNPLHASAQAHGLQGHMPLA